MTTKRGAQSKVAGTPWWQFWLLTIALLAVLIAWGLHAGLYAAGMPLKDQAGNIVPFWKVWEVSSVGVTAIITIVFWITFISGQNKEQESAFQGAQVRQIGSWILWLAVFFFAFVLAGLFAWFEGYIPLHVQFLALGVLSTVQLGTLAMRSIHSALQDCTKRLANPANDEEKKSIAQQVEDKIRVRDNITKYLCFSDTPIAFAMISLAVFVMSYHYFGQPHEELEMRAFIAGAVALQLLYSNIVYWIESFADTPWGRSWVNSMSPALEPIGRMLRPGHQHDEGMTQVEWAEAELNRLFPAKTRTGDE